MGKKRIEMNEIIIYGMGKVGKYFVDSSLFKLLHCERASFYDNNKSLPKEYNGVPRIDSIWDQNDQSIVIASGSWGEIYRECVLHGHSPLIYDNENDCLVSYLEMCKSHKITNSFCMMMYRKTNPLNV